MELNPGSNGGVGEALDAESVRVRELTESLSWDELNDLAMRGNDAANVEVIERAVHESGAPTPIYDQLSAKHRLLVTGK